MSDNNTTTKLLKTKQMNRNTFLQFCYEMKGLYIIDENNEIIHKYIAYHIGLDTLQKVENKYLINFR